jgi:hypothetical protein
MKADVPLLLFVGLVLSCTACDKRPVDDNSADSYEPAAGSQPASPPKPWEKSEKARLEGIGRESLEEDADLQSQFTHAAFLACKDPGTALAMLREIYAKSSPGSALHREAKRFIDELTASDGGTSLDAGVNGNGGFRIRPD